MGKNVVKNYYRKVEIFKAPFRKDKPPLLASLNVELTERCNNNCIHCYINVPADDDRARKRELSSEEIKRYLKEATSLGCLKVRFTGGEPLLRGDFEEIYIYARKIGLKVTIFTNGTLITPTLAELFSQIPPLEKVELSLYGLRKKSYEGVTRVPGSFEAAWRGINFLLEKKIPFIIKSAVLPPNREEFEDFEAFAQTIPWMDGRMSYVVALDLRARRDSERKNELIKTLRLSPREVLDLIARRPKDYLKEMKEFCLKHTHPGGENLFSCGAGKGSACLDSYGHLQVCLLLRHPETVYDLKEGNLKDALMHFFPKVLEKKAENHDYLARCAQCFLNGICDQCPAKSWMEHGTLDYPVDYLCKIAHAKGRYLGLLEEGGKAWEVKNWEERIERFSINEDF